MSEPRVWSFWLHNPGPRPPYYEVADHLWGVGSVFDSDGDSHVPGSREWTELTVVLRDDKGWNIESERLDIDPVSGKEHLVMNIRSENRALAKKAATFLQSECGGTLSER